MYNVHFLGIVYFNGACTSDDKIALVPNGLDGHGHAPPHYASIFVDSALHDSDSWWPEQKLSRQLDVDDSLSQSETFNVFEFRIPEPAEITFDCADRDLQAVGFDGGLPQLRKVNPKFRLDLEQPDAIARLPLPGGKLQAFRFGDAGAVQWTITKHSDPITITARTERETRRITLKKMNGTPPEIVFSNTPDLINSGPINSGPINAGPINAGPTAGPAIHAEHTPASRPDIKKPPPAPDQASDHSGHFMLYAKIDVKRDEQDLMNPQLPDFTLLRDLKFEHPYLRFLIQENQIPLPGCSPTCCAPKKI